MMMKNEPNGRPGEFLDDCHFWPEESYEDIVTDKEREIYKRHMKYRLETVREIEEIVSTMCKDGQFYLNKFLHNLEVERIKRDLEEMDPRKIRIFFDGAIYLKEEPKE